MTLSEQLAGIEEKLSQLDNNNRGDLAEISRLTTMQNELLAQQALEERVQVQETKVAAIILPYDFNELFGDPNANDIVIELIKDLQRQAYAEHNAELTEMATAHRDELRAAADRELQLKRQNDELQEVGAQMGEKLLSLRSDIGQAIIERDDALAKRDAAVREKEGIELLLAEKQAQIDTLRDEIAIGAKAAVNVTSIAGTDKLAQLIEASKQAKVKSAVDIALENPVPFRGKVISDGAVVQLNAPEVQPFRPIDQASDSGYQLVTGPVSELPADDQVEESFRRLEEVQAVSTGLVEGTSSEVGQGEKTLAEAFRRIEALEAKLGA